MKRILLPAAFLLAFSFFSCNGNRDETKKEDSAKPQNDAVPAAPSLFGKIFREPSELPELAAYSDIGGAVITDPSVKDFEYGIGWLQSANENMIILEKFIDQPDGKTKYQVVDTIMVPKYGPGEYISYCNCYANDVFDSRLIALVKVNEGPYYTEIIKAWRADARSGKIIPILDTKGIKCTNESFGAE